MPGTEDEVQPPPTGRNRVRTAQFPLSAVLGEEGRQTAPWLPLPRGHDAGFIWNCMCLAYAKRGMSTKDPTPSFPFSFPAERRKGCVLLSGKSRSSARNSVVPCSSKNKHTAPGCKGARISQKGGICLRSGKGTKIDESNILYPCLASLAICSRRSAGGHRKGAAVWEGQAQCPCGKEETRSDLSSLDVTLSWLWRPAALQVT